jgi:hypothetical protein
MNIIRTLVYSVALVGLSMCATKKQGPAEFGQVAELQVFNSKTSTETSSSGIFFIGIGAFDSQTKEVTKYWFYAKNNFDEYCRFTISPEKIKIKIDSIKIPTVKFIVDSADNRLCGFVYLGERKVFSNLEELQSCLELGRGYFEKSHIVITCSPCMFPKDINLKTLQKN